MATTPGIYPVEATKKPYDPLTDAIGNEFSTPQTAGTGIPAPTQQAQTTTGVPQPTATTQAVQPTENVTPVPTAPTTDTTKTAVPAPAPIDPNVAMNTVKNTFQAAMGRPMTDAELQQLIAAVGLQPGQPITQATIDQANQLISQYAASQNPTAPPPAGTPKPADPDPGVTPLPGTIPNQPTPEGPEPAPIDPNVAMNQVQAAFTAAMGRPMTDAELQQLIGALGLQPGQPITQAHIDQALAIIKQYAAAPPAPTPGTPEQPGAPAAPPPGTVDPNVALNNARAAFQTRFGRDMTQAEIDALLKAVGYTGGPVTDAMMAQALDLISKYSGNIGDPWGTGTPGTTPTTPGEEEETEAERLARERLEELLSEHWGEVDPNDPALRGQMEANQLAMQRGTNRKRAALAERAAARGGLGSGGFDVDTERLIQEQGEGEQSFNAKLYANELQQQRDRLMQGIEMAQQYGLQQDAQALQEELAKLDIKLREYLGKGNLGLGLLEQLMQDQRFYDEMGFNMAKFLQYINSQAISGMFA